jgi:4-hydroxybenzoate polyprenyltransferase
LPDATSSQPSSSQPSSRIIAWGQLVRLPNVFTVLADVGAAFLLVSGGPAPMGRLVCVLLGAVLLYWAGMILNDVFDVDVDRAQRSNRPLAAGTVSISAAKQAGWSLLALGILIAGASGYLPSANDETTWLPLVVAILLAITIVAYDGPLKKTPLAPAAMGGCRVLSFLLGASPLLGTVDGFLVPKYVLGTAVGMGTYVMGLTLFGRREASGGPSLNLPTGMLVTLFGAVLLAVAPQLNRAPIGWHVADLRFTFPMLIGLIAFPVVVRAIRAVQDPSPAKIQVTMRIGILTIIPLSAAFAFLGAGQLWGLAVFSLVVPSLILARSFRVT